MVEDAKRSQLMNTCLVAAFTRSQRRKQLEASETESMATGMQLPTFNTRTNAERFLLLFEDYCIVNSCKPEQKPVYFGLALKDTANDWYYNQKEEIRKDWAALKKAFEEQFKSSTSEKLDHLGQFFTSKQQPHEKATDYVIRMTTLAGSEVSDSTIISTIIKGFNSTIKPLIVVQDPANLQELGKIAKKADDTVNSTENERVCVLQRQVETLQEQMETNFAKLTAQITVANVQTSNRSHSPHSRGSHNYRARNPSNGQGNFSGQTSYNQKRVTMSKTCKYCGECHSFDRNCPKFKNKRCFRCGVIGHISTQCRKGYRSQKHE